MDIIKSWLNDLRDEIEEMSEDEIEIENADKTVDMVKKFIDFNKQKKRRTMTKSINSRSNS